jgi:DNA repair protein RecO (recombination protein O)
MSRDQLQQAFVLHRRDFSNTSLLLEVFSAEHGRLPLVAKGAKRGAGRGSRSALLEPFQPLWLTWSGRGEVGTLTRAEAAGTPLALAGDALYCGFYLNELLLRLLGRQDAHQALFVFYQQALDGLSRGESTLPAVLRRFELRLLAELGWELVLSRDAEGRPVAPEGWYLFQPERGLLPTWSADPSTAIRGSTLLGLDGDRPLDSAAAREARGLLRAALAPHLGGRPLKSRELFRRPNQGGGAGLRGD